MQSNLNNFSPITQYREIPSLIIAHECGFNSQLYEGAMEYKSIPEILLTGVKNPFFAYASGNSMAPLINQGDELIVELTTNIMSGDVVTCLLNNILTCKKFVKVNYSIYLKSINPDFNDYKLTDEDSFEILGVVKKVIKSI